MMGVEDVDEGDDDDVCENDGIILFLIFNDLKCVDCMFIDVMIE